MTRIDLPGRSRVSLAKLLDVSWRIKVPLAITAVILITEVVVTIALVTRALADARRDLKLGAEGLAVLLAQSLREPLIRDDLWLAYEVIQAPLRVRPSDSPLRGMVVLDRFDQVFVASEPRRYPVLMAGAELPALFRELASSAGPDPAVRFRTGAREGGPDIAAAAPVLAQDGDRLGTILLEYDGSIQAQRARVAIAEVALISIPGLLILVPLGWLAGKRLAEPLARIASALSTVAARRPEEVLRQLGALPVGDGDEVARLTREARSMLLELERKAALEREVMAADRLAAIGRVSAAIAHEINNPLGGMLNAIDTASRYGKVDAVTATTLGLLQRGLQQIRSIVSALLVEARYDAPHLSAQDWADLRMLVQPDALARKVELRWEVAEEPRGSLALPGHEVRQLTLNLLLNAIEAATAQDTQDRPFVRLQVAVRHNRLQLEVSNSGEILAPERINTMFEPFVSGYDATTERRRGLGLWVCWQLVHRLGGSIQLSSASGQTCFAVCLPIAGAQPPG